MKKRKFFSFMLMGLLTVGATSMISSCKDYDDDINNLQEQIDKAALKTDLDNLSSQLSTAASTASSAASTAQQALTKANANETAIATVTTTATNAGTQAAQAITDAANAQKSADDAAAAAAAADTKAQTAIENAAKNASDIATIQTELQSLGLSTKDYVTAEKLKTSIDSLANVLTQTQTDSLAALSKKVDAYKGGINALYSAVTSVSLVGTITGNSTVNDLNNSKFNSGLELDFTSSVIGTFADDATSFEFGVNEQSAKKGVKGAADPTYTYTTGTRVGQNTDLLIRVSPTNAVLDKSMIKLINSQGADLNDALEITGVEKYTGLLTRASSSNTGLWVVHFQVKDAITEQADLDKYGKDPDDATKSVLYAVAVNNTKDQAENSENAADRDVVSSYDVTLGTITALTPASSLDKVQVYDQLHKQDNRTDQTIANTKGDGERNSSAMDTKYVSANNGDTIIVDFSNEAVSKYQYFYVVRDDDYAGESDASELNAWNNYTYTGVALHNINKGLTQKGTMFEVKNGEGKGKIVVDIPSSQVVGDEIGFRIFAVNYDGTVTPANGASFRVYVGVSNSQNTISGNVLVKSETATENVSDTIALPTLAGTTTLPTTVTLNDGKTDINFNVAYYEDAKAETSATTADKAKYAVFTLNTAPATWLDGSTATGKLTVKNATTGVVENELTVNLKKVLPDAAAAKALLGFKWKTNQLVNGVYNAYMEASDWTDFVTKGTKDFFQAWNLASTADKDKMILKIEKDDEGTDANGNTIDVTKTYTGESEIGAVEALNKYIDQSTKHASTLAYNWGHISSKSNDDAKNDANYAAHETSGTIDYYDYAPVFESFQTEFDCPLNKSVNVYSWVETLAKNTVIGSTTLSAAETVKAELTYNVSTEVEHATAHIKVVNSSRNDGFINAKTLYAQLPYWVSTTNSEIKAKLVTVGGENDGTEEYFTVDATDIASGKLTFTPQSSATVPTSAVNSKLVITGKDAFDHDVTVEITGFKVNPPASAAKKH